MEGGGTNRNDNEPRTTGSQKKEKKEKRIKKPQQMYL